MDVVALSPVAASRLVWRKGPDRWALTVVVKATFDLVPGELRPASQLAPVYGADVHEGGNPAQALIAPNDLVPFKARADVLLVGHAYGPHGRPVSALVARLAIGGVDKAIVVHGNRVVSPRGVGPALPFAKMRLSWDRAAGGPGTANPIGIPRGDRLPNLEPPGWSPGRGDAKAGPPAPPPPVGFGPIPPSWPERAARQRAWRLDEPLPDDFDPAFFNAAPADQQAAFLRGDEALVLEHLHPDHTTLATRLPGLVPRVFVDRPRLAPAAVEMLADTLWIDTDRRKLCVVWRGEAALAARDEPGRVLVAVTSAREPMTYERMFELYRALSATGADPAADDEAGDEDAEDELRSTNAVPAARFPGAPERDARLGPFAALPSFDDEDSADDLPSHLDALGSSTRAFPVPDGVRIPDAAPAWLAPPSREVSTRFAPSGASPREARVPPAAEVRRDASVPHRPPTLASHAAPLPHPENAPPLDLVWDGPADSDDRGTLPPPLAAEGIPPFPRAAESPEPPAELQRETRTGPLPAVGSMGGHNMPVGGGVPGGGNVPVGVNVPVGHSMPVGASAPVGGNVPVGHSVGVGAGVPVGGNVPVGPGAPVGHNMSVGGNVPVGHNMPVGAGVPVGPVGPVAPAPAEPASPWASGLDPSNTAAPVAPVPLPSAVVMRPDVAPEPPRPERRVTYRGPSEAVDLVWFDPAAVPRIAARFRELVDELDMEPLDPAHDLPVDDPIAARDRHHVFGVLTRAPLTEPRGVPAAVRAATDAHGRFTPPLVVVEGDLVFGLDERALLKTTAACARPLAKDNKRLQDVLASVDEVLETPLLLGAAGASDSLLRDMLSAASQSKRALPAKVLEEHVERLLLSERAYQLRTVLGGPQIRAALVPARDSLALVSYLPEAVGPRLPLSPRFRARLVAEVHPSPDPQEPAPLALRVVALGRVVQVPGRG